VDGNVKAQGEEGQDLCDGKEFFGKRPQDGNEKYYCRHDPVCAVYDE